MLAFKLTKFITGLHFYVNSFYGKSRDINEQAKLVLLQASGPLAKTRLIFIIQLTNTSVWLIYVLLKLKST